MRRRSLVGLLSLVVLGTPSCGGSGGSDSDGCGGQLYAAAGRGSALGNLYLVDPATAAATVIGPIGWPVGAMAIGPDCTLWAVTAGNDPTTSGRLLTIDRSTGAGSLVAELLDGSATPYRTIAGIAFDGDVLYGWVADGARSGGQNNELVTINTATGLVTAIGGNDFATDSWEGNGLAFAPNGTLYASSYDGDNMLLTVDPATGDATKIDNFTQNSTTPDSVKAFTFLGTTLLAIEHARTTGGASLVSIDLATAVTTPIGLLPLDSSALAYAP